jgi:HrpJ-like domain/TyeA
MVEVRGPTQLAGHAAMKAKGKAAEPEAVGRRRGERVVSQKDTHQIAQEMIQSLGGDAWAEEMENELGREQRRVSNSDRARTVGAGGGGPASEAQNVNPEDVSDAQERRDEIETLAREASQQGVHDPDDLLQFVRQRLGGRKGEAGPSDDPTLHYGALGIMERLYAREHDTEMSAAARVAGDRLLATNGKVIQRGVAVTEAAALYAAERFGSVSDLRALYSQEVVNYKSIPSTFNTIVDKHGAEGVAEAIAFLLRAAGDDLAMMSEKRDLTLQKQIIDNLYQLEVLNSIRERAGKALEAVRRHHPVSPGITPERVMKETLEMIDTPGRISEQSISKFVNEAIPGSVEGRIALLREYRNVTGMLPIKLFDEADRSGNGLRLRERLIGAIMQAQDVADAQEQEKLGAT